MPERYVARKHGSESVTLGHPDALCDFMAGRIHDEALRYSLALGKLPRVAMEAAIKGDINTGGFVALLGEITLPPHVTLDHLRIARKAIRDAGYTDVRPGFHDGLSDAKIKITAQSEDIAVGVDRKEGGAGDQGIFIAGAIKGEGSEEETHLMPMPIMIAHGLTERLRDVRESGMFPYLRPDGKSQVVVGYNSRGRPISVEKVTLAASHDSAAELGQIRRDLQREVVEPVLDRFHFGLKDDDRLIVNGTGAFSNYGPLADAGLTNRKIAVNQFGGAFRNGGGGLNGKDATKVDVSGAVFARYVSKALVANGLADKVEIEIGYTIGQPAPDYITIDTFGTQHVSLKLLHQIVDKTFDFSVEGILGTLNLFQPIYAQLASGGWFGRPGLPWEQVRSI